MTTNVFESSYQLSIWDLRVKENGGCVHTIMGSVGDMLYAVATSSSGNVAVSGGDRTVTVYDPRRSVVLPALPDAKFLAL